MRLIKESVGKKVKRRGNSKEKDCKTKHLILSVVATEPMTVSEIYERSRFTGTKASLAGMINTYYRYGYLYRLGKKPYHYDLTELGEMHLEDPYKARNDLIERYQRAIKMGVDAYIETHNEELLSDLIDKMGSDPHFDSEKASQIIEKFKDRFIPVPSEESLSKSDSVNRATITTSPEYRELICLLEEQKKRNEDLELELEKEKFKNENIEAPVTMKLPSQNSNAKSKVRKYDVELFSHIDKKLDKEFFDAIPYSLYIVTAVSISNLKNALNNIVSVAQGEVILLYKPFAKSDVDRNFIRELTEAEFKKYKPVLRIGENKVYIQIINRNKKLDEKGNLRKHFFFEMCDAPVKKQSTTPRPSIPKDRRD